MFNLDNYNDFIVRENTSLITERFKSEVFRIVNKADKNSSRTWYKSFMKDFYSVFNISIEKIENEDVTEIKPEDFFGKQPYNLHPEQYLAIFINDDVSLKHSAKSGITRISAALAKAKQDNAPKSEINKLSADLDTMKAVDVPFLVAIAMGKRVVYHGFVQEPPVVKDEDLPPVQGYGTPHEIFRYGINAARWLQPRYFGTSKGTQVTARNTAERSTKCFVVDIEDLKLKYDMGSKIEDRANAKVNNPFFAYVNGNYPEIAKENMRKYKLLQNKKLDPKSILAMYKAFIEAYTKSYLDRIKVLDEKSFGSFMNQKIAIDGHDINGVSNVFSQFDSLLKDYFKVYTEYLRFLKEYPEYAKNFPKRDKPGLKAKEKEFVDKNENFLISMIEFKEKAQSLYSDMVKNGVTFSSTAKKTLDIK